MKIKNAVQPIQLLKIKHVCDRSTTLKFVLSTLFKSQKRSKFVLKLFLWKQLNTIHATL